MMNLLFIISVIFLLVYCLFLFLFLLASIFTSKKKALSTEKQDFPFITVICCARNEEKNLVPLLDSLQKQNYPKEKLELIFVSDHSSDNTNQILKNYVASSEAKISLLIRKEELPSKKKSIELGIKNAQGEIVLFTDADCIVESNWVETYTKLFQNNNIVFATGRLQLSAEKNSFLSAFQNMEWFALMSITRTSATLKYPIMANGANMAIRKNAFIKLRPYQNNYNIASGDDMYLLESVVTHFGRKTIAFNNKTTVVTAATKKWNSFFYQRIRWAKKNYYGNIKPLMAASFVFIANLSTIILFLFAFIKQDSLAVILLLLTLKFVGEFSFPLLQKQKIHTLIYFPISFILYPFYVVLIAISSLFIAVKWKGHKTKA
jgi:poly-beta-1,6-N-acetyl-D-glucosamine synthase